MKRKQLLFLLLSLTMMRCQIYSQNRGGDEKAIQGNWVSIEDSSYTMSIYGSQIKEYYNSKLTETYNFSLSNASCDEKYLSSNKTKILFLKKKQDNDMFCYELTSLDNSNLSLIYTTNGRVATFKKKK